MASSSPAILSLGRRTSRPRDWNSSSEEPAPSPRIKRPPERRSKLSAIFATTAGFRYGTPRTRVATRIREVLAAIHASVVQASYLGVGPCR